MCKEAFALKYGDILRKNSKLVIPESERVNYLNFLFHILGLPNKEMSAMALGLAHRFGFFVIEFSISISMSAFFIEKPVVLFFFSFTLLNKVLLSDIACLVIS